MDFINTTVFFTTLSIAIITGLWKLFLYAVKKKAMEIVKDESVNYNVMISKITDDVHKMRDIFEREIQEIHNKTNILNLEKDYQHKFNSEVLKRIDNMEQMVERRIEKTENLIVRQLETFKSETKDQLADIKKVIEKK